MRIEKGGVAGGATFFANPTAFRKWLKKNHATESELLVGFYKKDSGRPSMTWPESVDEALCFGWIDGVRKRIDEVSYSIRFTPRKPTSNWSAVNIRRVAELTSLGRMEPAGVRAFERRREDRSSIYAYENAPRTLDPDDEKEFQSNRKAWKYFSGQAPSYRRVAIYWVVSAKRLETRARRLKLLIDDSAAERRLAQYTLEKRSTP
ncbi:MAG TPA: YdeI/OmpD-associated family protein [Thermoanaerobaculia bacterium]|nr:YdeI/OmpD-associated family protein [Thermoanaerobaculia bacterium]